MYFIYNYFMMNSEVLWWEMILLLSLTKLSIHSKMPFLLFDVLVYKMNEAFNIIQNSTTFLKYLVVM